MAFQSTKQRYEYIYGSSVRKLEAEPVREPQPVREPRPVREARPARQPQRRRTEPVEETTESMENVRRNRTRFLEFDWKYMAVVSLAIVICSVACILYVSKTARINRMNREIYDLKAEKVALLSKQDAIRSEIDKSINLKEIETYAKEKLHMKYPDSSSTINYSASSGDYVRQYESVSALK